MGENASRVAITMFLLYVLYAVCILFTLPVTGFTIDFDTENELGRLQPDLLTNHSLSRQNYLPELGSSTDVLLTPVVLWGEDMGSETERCHTFMINLADLGGNFTHCLIRHSQPFRICEKCVKEYTRFENLYKALLADPTCKRVLLMSDRKESITSIYNVFHSSWASSLCDRCFDSITENTTTGQVFYNFTAETIWFQMMELEVSQCFQNYSHVIGPTNNQSEACNACLMLYEKMNHNFSAMSKRSSGQVCMDIVDMMNNTWLAWSDFNCPRFHFSPAIVITIASVVCITTVLLYVLSGILARARMHELAESKRMKSCQNRRRYSTFSSTEPAVFTPGQIQIGEHHHDH